MTTLVTGYEARDRYGIPIHRVHLWSHHGRVRPVRYAARSPLFDLDDLLRLNRAAEADPRAKSAGTTSLPPKGSTKSSPRA